LQDRDGLTIRSFRVVFDLERRIHKVDRWRIPTPYGVPLRGIAYWVAALVVIILLGRMPLTSGLSALLPPPIRFVILPVAVAAMLARVRVDGRSAHTAIASWVRFRLSPSRLASLRSVPRAGAVIRLGELALVPDERGAGYRSARLKGPATVLLRYPPEGWVKGRRRPELHVSQLAGPPLFVGKQVRLEDGQRIVLHG
jgi:hypothetical protein